MLERGNFVKLRILVKAADPGSQQYYEETFKPRLVELLASRA